MLEHLSRRGRVLLVVDQPNTIGSLPLTVARDMGIAVAYLPGTGMAETIIPSIARDIKAIKDRRREVGRQVEKLLEDHPLLTVPASMPGIGVRTASSILLGIGGDIANFKSAAHLAAYAGIAPVTGQSGTSIKGERDPPDGATNASGTRCGSPCSSRPPNTRRPSPTTSANANRASTTTPSSSASPADAAT